MTGNVGRGRKPPIKKRQGRKWVKANTRKGKGGKEEEGREKGGGGCVILRQRLIELVAIKGEAYLIALQRGFRFLFLCRQRKWARW